MGKQGREGVLEISTQRLGLEHRSDTEKKRGFTWAMSHTVTLGSREAKSKQWTGFRILEARRQSPQPKSATTRDAGLGVEGRDHSLI